MVLVVGIFGGIYVIFGGLKMVVYIDIINGFGLLIVGLLVFLLVLIDIGGGSVWEGLSKVFVNSLEKFNVVS